MIFNKVQKMEITDVVLEEAKRFGDMQYKGKEYLIIKTSYGILYQYPKDYYNKDKEEVKR